MVGAMPKQNNTVQSNIQVQGNKQNQKNLERIMAAMKSALIHSWMEAPVYMHMLKSELNAEVHFLSNVNSNETWQSFWCSSGNLI